MTDNEIIKAFDIIDKFEFFGGQRAGRELWFNKPADIQEKDIGAFLRDLDFLKQFINHQKAEIENLSIALEVTRDNLGDTRKELNKAETEIERLKSMNQSKLDMIHDLRTELETARAEAIKEFAERLKESAFDCDVSFGYGREHYEKAVAVIQIDNLVKEMVGEQE